MEKMKDKSRLLLKPPSLDNKEDENIFLLEFTDPITSKITFEEDDSENEDKDDKLKIVDIELDQSDNNHISFVARRISDERRSDCLEFTLNQLKKNDNKKELHAKVMSNKCNEHFINMEYNNNTISENIRSENTDDEESASVIPLIKRNGQTETTKLNVKKSTLFQLSTEENTSLNDNKMSDTKNKQGLHKTDHDKISSKKMKTKSVDEKPNLINKTDNLFKNMQYIDIEIDLNEDNHTNFTTKLQNNASKITDVRKHHVESTSNQLKKNGNKEELDIKMLNNERIEECTNIKYNNTISADIKGNNDVLENVGIGQLTKKNDQKEPTEANMKKSNIFQLPYHIKPTQINAADMKQTKNYFKQRNIRKDLLNEFVINIHYDVIPDNVKTNTNTVATTETNQCIPKITKLGIKNPNESKDKIKFNDTSQSSMKKNDVKKALNKSNNLFENTKIKKRNGAEKGKNYTDDEYSAIQKIKQRLLNDTSFYEKSVKVLANFQLPIKGRDILFKMKKNPAFVSKGYGNDPSTSAFDNHVKTPIADTNPNICYKSVKENSNIHLPLEGKNILYKLNKNPAIERKRHENIPSTSAFDNHVKTPIVDTNPNVCYKSVKENYNVQLSLEGKDILYKANKNSAIVRKRHDNNISARTFNNHIKTPTVYGNPKIRYKSVKEKAKDLSKANKDRAIGRKMHDNIPRTNVFDNCVEAPGDHIDLNMCNKSVIENSHFQAFLEEKDILNKANNDSAVGRKGHDNTSCNNTIDNNVGTSDGDIDLNMCNKSVIEKTNFQLPLEEGILNKANKEPAIGSKMQVNIPCNNTTDNYAETQRDDINANIRNKSVMEKKANKDPAIERKIHDNILCTTTFNSCLETPTGNINPNMYNKLLIENTNFQSPLNGNKNKEPAIERKRYDNNPCNNIFDKHAEALKVDVNPNYSQNNHYQSHVHNVPLSSDTLHMLHKLSENMLMIFLEVQSYSSKINEALSLPHPNKFEIINTATTLLTETKKYYLKLSTIIIIAYVYPLKDNNEFKQYLFTLTMTMSNYHKLFKEFPSSLYWMVWNDLISQVNFSNPVLNLHDKYFLNLHLKQPFTLP